MKYFFAISICAFGLSFPQFSLALDKEVGLPYEPDMTPVQLQPLKKGKQLHLEFMLSLPSSEKLNKGAPSFVAVYEKPKGEKAWKEIQKFDLNSFWFLNSDEIHFSRSLEVQTEDSEIAVHSTVFHCGKEKHTPCFIQGFKGKTSRSAQAASMTLPFYIRGTAQ